MSRAACKQQPAAIKFLSARPAPLPSMSLEELGEWRGIEQIQQQKNWSYVWDWKRRGFSAKEASRWIEAGVVFCGDAETAGNFAEANFSPEEAKRFIGLGCEDAETAASLREEKMKEGEK